MSPGGGSAKVMPQLADAGSTKVLNLTVLQRIDPFIEEILMTAAHVTFYEFNIDRSQWSRKDIEGSLFVVKRNSQPRFQFIVMNRRNTENLVEDLLGDFEYEVQVPYLLYRNANQEVNGIWFYNPQDCEAIGNIFSRILNAFSKVPAKPKVSSNKRSEFEELEAIPTSSVIEGPLEPQASSSRVRPDATDASFVNFFTSSMSIGNAAVAGQPHQSSATISSHVLNAVPSASSLQTIQPAQSLTTSIPPVPLLDPNESSIYSNSRSTDLIKPSFFGPPASSSSLMRPPVSSSSSLPTAPSLHPAVTTRPYGTPLLQAFPPPTPPPSLTPASNYGQFITKEKLRDALLRLVKNENFIDMVHQEMLNSHYS